MLRPLGQPQLLGEAKELAKIYAEHELADIAKLMAVSPKKAEDVRLMQQEWSVSADVQIPAIDAFVGDIYSGLQVQAWSKSDREYAQGHLIVLSGLYGALRACDGIMPYRLEMGYKLPDGSSLYAFWQGKLAKTLPKPTSGIVNLSAVEYTKALLPYCNQSVVTPKFLTVSPKTGEPMFVTVHTKIARGAFAKWMITERIDDVARLKEFADLNYRFDAALSSTEQPVFVAERFGGLGLSVRLTK